MWWLLPSLTRHPKTKTQGHLQCSLPSRESSEEKKTFMMIWVHKGMIAKGASEPQPQMDASLGLPRADEQQSQ